MTKSKNNILICGLTHKELFDSLPTEYFDEFIPPKKISKHKALSFAKAAGLRWLYEIDIIYFPKAYEINNPLWKTSFIFPQQKYFTSEKHLINVLRDYYRDLNQRALFKKVNFGINLDCFRLSDLRCFNPEGKQTKSNAGGLTLWKVNVETYLNYYIDILIDGIK